MAKLLSITGATKRYNTPSGVITALDNISLDVEKNEFVTLLGPSGCGKTTLLRTISGFEDLESGAIAIDGVTVTHLPAHKRPVNTVFQRYALFPHMTIARNVAYSLEIQGIDKGEITRRVGEMLERVGLDGYGDRKVTQLSGGQQQRVALARSLVAQPKILLLDEPLSALDKNLRQKMQQELKTLQADVGIAFVFVTHDQEEALTMSDRIVVLSDGKIQQLGSPEDLYRRPENEFVARFVGEGNLLDATITAAEDGTAVAALRGGQQITVAQSGMRQNRAVKLLIRPEDVEVGVPADGGALTFDGTVSQVFFVGTDYLAHLTTGDGQEIKAMLRPGADQRTTLATSGAKVPLFVRQTAVHVIDTDGAL